VLRKLGIQLRDSDLNALIARQRLKQTAPPPHDLARHHSSRRSAGSYPHQTATLGGHTPRVTPPLPAVPQTTGDTERVTHRATTPASDAPLNWLPPAADVREWHQELQRHRAITSRVVSPGHEMLHSSKPAATTAHHNHNHVAGTPTSVDPRAMARAALRSARAPVRPPGQHSRMSARRGSVHSRASSARRGRLRARTSNSKNPGSASTCGGAASVASSVAPIDYYRFVVDVVGQPGCARASSSRRQHARRGSASVASSMVRATCGVTHTHAVGWAALRRPLCRVRLRCDTFSPHAFVVAVANGCAFRCDDTLFLDVVLCGCCVHLVVVWAWGVVLCSTHSSPHRHTVLRATPQQQQQQLLLVLMITTTGMWSSLRPPSSRHCSLHAKPQRP